MAVAILRPYESPLMKELSIERYRKTFKFLKFKYMDLSLLDNSSL